MECLQELLIPSWGGWDCWTRRRKPQQWTVVSFVDSSFVCQSLLRSQWEVSAVPVEWLSSLITCQHSDLPLMLTTHFCNCISFFLYFNLGQFLVGTTIFFFLSVKISSRLNFRIISGFFTSSVFQLECVLVCQMPAVPDPGLPTASCVVIAISLSIKLPKVRSCLLVTSTCSLLVTV